MNKKIENSYEYKYFELLDRYETIKGLYQKQQIERNNQISVSLSKIWGIVIVTIVALIGIFWNTTGLIVIGCIILLTAMMALLTMGN